MKVRPCGRVRWLDHLEDLVRPVKLCYHPRERGVVGAGRRRDAPRSPKGDPGEHVFQPPTPWPALKRQRVEPENAIRGRLDCRPAAHRMAKRECDGTAEPGRRRDRSISPLGGQAARAAHAPRRLPTVTGASSRALDEPFAQREKVPQGLSLHRSNFARLGRREMSGPRDAPGEIRARRGAA